MPSLALPASLVRNVMGPNPSWGLLAEDPWLLRERRWLVPPPHIRRSTSTTSPRGGTRQKARGRSIPRVQTEHLLQNPDKSSLAVSSEQLPLRKAGHVHQPNPPSVFMETDRPK